MILLTRVYSRIALKIFRIEPYEIKKKVFPVIAHENYWYRVFIRSKVWFFSNLSICVECLQKERKCYWIYFIRSHVMILDNYHIKEKKGEIFFVWTKGSRETAFFFWNQNQRDKSSSSLLRFELYGIFETRANRLM